MQVAHSCEGHGAAGCEVYPFDLLKTDQIGSLAKKVLGERQIDVLVNNAGIMVAGSAHQGLFLPGRIPDKIGNTLPKWLVLYNATAGG